LAKLRKFSLTLLLLTKAVKTDRQLVERINVVENNREIVDEANSGPVSRSHSEASHFSRASWGSVHLDGGGGGDAATRMDVEDESSNAASKLEKIREKAKEREVILGQVCGVLPALFRSFSKLSSADERVDAGAEAFEVLTETLTTVFKFLRELLGLALLLAETPVGGNAGASSSLGDLKYLEEGESTTYSNLTP
jgi:hypothetical protein